MMILFSVITVITMDQLFWPDYLILVAFLVISVGIGVYHSLTGGRQRTTSEFIMANRSLKVLPTTLSLLVSFQSALIILGMTAEMYSYGSHYFILSMFSFTLAIILTTQVAVPWMYPMKLVSVNEVSLAIPCAAAISVVLVVVVIIIIIFITTTIISSRNHSNHLLLFCDGLIIIT